MKMDSINKRLASSGWGQDRITDFLEHAEHNVKASFLMYPDIFNHARGVGLLMEEAVEAVKKSEVDYPSVFRAFLGRSYGCFLGGIRLSASGQFVESCALLRICIENALYAFYIGHKPELGEIWLNREHDEESKKAVRRTFKISLMFNALADSNSVVGEMAWKFYENTISFGAHPNPMSVGLNLYENDDMDTDEYRILNSDNIKESLSLNARAGLFSISIFRLIYPKEFEQARILERLNDLWLCDNEIAVKYFIEKERTTDE